MSIFDALAKQFREAGGLAGAITSGAEAGAGTGLGLTLEETRAQIAKERAARISPGRAWADLKQFPRATATTAYARKVGFPPWERESLTIRERQNGSLFGGGAVDKSWETSEGEARADNAVRRNNLRAQVRVWFDEGRTDAEIADFIRSGQGVDPFLVLGTVLSWNGIPPDILKRFGLI